jgi:hypothetical protein
MVTTDIQLDLLDEIADRRISAGVPPSRFGDRQSHRAPRRLLRCRRCGFAVDTIAGHPDEALLRASCCPRCDGRLVMVAAGARRAPRPRAEPSIYVG